MNPKANQRVSAGRVVLFLALLLGVWLAFQFYPQPVEPAPAPVPVPAGSKLQAVGLENNPDWDSLPEFFAVWANKIEWHDDRAYFAYWHPGSRTYAYFFEATRQGSGFRFREVSPQRLADEGYSAEDTASPLQVARLDTATPTHPFVFLRRKQATPPDRPVMPVSHPPEPVRSKIPVDLKPDPLVVPPPAKAGTP